MESTTKKLGLREGLATAQLWCKTQVDAMKPISITYSVLYLDNSVKSASCVLGYAAGASSHETREPSSLDAVTHVYIGRCNVHS